MRVLRVRIDRSPEGAIDAFSVDGHAGAGPYGTDIVCAGVSALAQAAVLGLERQLGLDVHVTTAGGHLACRLPAGIDAGAMGRAQDVLETMRLGLCAIAAAYPGRIRVADAPGGPVGVPRGKAGTGG